MFNPEMLLGQLLQSGLGGGLGRTRRGHRGGSLLGGLSSGTRAQIGMGLLGVAMAAYEHYTKQNQSSVSPSPSPSPSPSSLPNPAGAGPAPVPSMPRSSLPRPAESSPSPQRAGDATLLVQAMVAAAAADGVIDETERAQIVRRANDAGFDEETMKFLDTELTQPKSLAVILKSSRPELATDLYAASCAAITADTDAEKAYLDTLARHLNLSSEARDEIHRQLGVA